MYLCKSSVFQQNYLLASISAKGVNLLHSVSKVEQVNEKATLTLLLEKRVYRSLLKICI